MNDIFDTLTEEPKQQSDIFDTIIGTENTRDTTDQNKSNFIVTKGGMVYDKETGAYGDIDALPKEQRDTLVLRNNIDRYKKEFSSDNAIKQSIDSFGTKLVDLFGVQSLAARKAPADSEGKAKWLAMQELASERGWDDPAKYTGIIGDVGRMALEFGAIGKGLSAVGKAVPKLGFLAAPVGAAAKAESLIPLAGRTAATFAAQRALDVGQEETWGEKALGVFEAGVTGGIVGAAGRYIPNPFVRVPAMMTGFGGVTYAQTKDIDASLESAITVLAFEVPALAIKTASLFKGGDKLAAIQAIKEANPDIRQYPDAEIEAAVEKVILQNKTELPANEQKIARQDQIDRQELAKTETIVDTKPEESARTPDEIASQNESEMKMQSQVEAERARKAEITPTPALEASKAERDRAEAFAELDAITRPTGEKYTAGMEIPAVAAKTAETPTGEAAGKPQTFSEWMSKFPDKPFGYAAENGYAFYLEKQLGRTPTVAEMKQYGNISRMMDEPVKNPSPTDTPIESKPTREMPSTGASERVANFTPSETINRDFATLRNKLGEKKARTYFTQVDKLFNPNKVEVVEYRENGVVTKEGDKYTFNALSDTSMKQWRIGFKKDISDQFKQTPQVANEKAGNGGGDPQTAPVESTEIVPERSANQVKESVDVTVELSKPLGDRKPISEITSARQEDIDADRVSLGLNIVNSKERIGWQSSLKAASDSGIPEKAMRIAAEINEKPRALDHIETAGLVIKATELKNEYKGLMQKLRSTKDPVDIQTLSAEAGRIEQEFDVVSQAVHKSGTEKGRNLVSQKLALDADFDLISVVTRAKAKKGKELTQKEHNQFSDLTTKLDDAVQKIDDLQRQINEMSARNFIRENGVRRYKNMSKAQKDSELTSLVESTKKLLKDGCYN